MKKEKMTLEQHQKLGTYLKDMQDTLVTLSVFIGNHCPQHLYKKACRSEDALRHLRHHLDEYVFTQYPEETTRTLINVYYGDRNKTRVEL